MKFKQYITEIFDTDIKISKMINKENEYILKFIINDKEVEFFAKYIDNINKKYYWQIDFTTNKGWVITKDNKDSFKIFSGIIKSLEKFIKEKKPERFTFNAFTPSRVKLYKKLSSNIGKISNYKFLGTKKDLQTYFYFSKNKEDIWDF